MHMSRFAITAALLAALSLGTSPADAGKKDDTLTWISNSEPDNIEMYQNTLREGIILGLHIWDTLVHSDPHTGEIGPNLAKSYSWADDTTIDFELREDVVFHNGDPFSADDVVFTLNWAANPANVKASHRTHFIAGAEKLGPYKVRVKLKEPFPAALQYLATAITIYPKNYYEQVGPKGMATKPVGTGPYKVIEVSYGKRIVLEKFDKYMEGGPKTPSIGKLVFRQVEEKGTQLAELLSGGADWLWRIQPDIAKKLEGRRGIAVTEGETMRIGFVTLDANGKAGKTPVNDLRVRQAINHAIDRETIRTQLVGAGSRVINTACFPSQFGCIDKDVTRYDYDLAKAKQLLAEAGYPNGFEIEFVAYRDRPIAEALIGQLRNAGITAKLRYMTAGAYREYRRQSGTPMAFGTWGSSSINDVTAAIGNFFYGGPDDQYEDKDVIALIDKGNSTDPEVRKEAYAKALALISEKAYWVPLFSFSYTYAYTDQLDFTPSPDEIPRFWAAKWK